MNRHPIDLPRLVALLLAAAPLACSDDAAETPAATTGTDTGADTRGPGTGTSAGDATSSSTANDGADTDTSGSGGGTGASSSDGESSGAGSTGADSGSDSGSSSGTGIGAVSFSADVAPILQANCVPNCHEPGGEWPFQDLLNGPYDALVGVPAMQAPDLDKVEPGSPEQSYLWHKLNGTQVDAGGSGLTMPKALPGQDAVVLTPAQLQTIETWILDGAPDN